MATAERSEKSRSWARRHIGEKGDDAVQSYYNGVRILSGSGFQASIVAVVSMMFPKEEFHLDQQKEFLPFHFTTDLRYFTEPEFQREIPIQMLEQRYANENAIWDAAACGNTEAALKACQQMARFTYGGRFFGSLYQTKIMLTVMNTLLRKAIERSNIHPYYIDEISSRYALMIENMVDEESWPLVQTMVKEYCAYVRRYSLQQYSPLVQKVINTINLNLSDQLSPKSLAAMYYISIVPLQPVQAGYRNHPDRFYQHAAHPARGQSVELHRAEYLGGGGAGGHPGCELFYQDVQKSRWAAPPPSTAARAAHGNPRK